MARAVIKHRQLSHPARRHDGRHRRIVQHLHNLACHAGAISVGGPPLCRVLLIALNMVPPVTGRIHRHQIFLTYLLHLFLSFPAPLGA